MTKPMAPLPIPMTRAMRVFRTTRNCHEIASYICDRGWRGDGVRVFAWPCGTVAVVARNSGADEAMMVRCPANLVATYACNGELSAGPIFMRVLHELRLVRAT